MREDHWTIVLVPRRSRGSCGRLYGGFDREGRGLSLSIDGREVLTAADATFAYGQAGPRMATAGRMTVARLVVEEL